MQISPYFNDVLQNVPNHIASIMLPDNFEKPAFDIVYKFMYANKIDDEELHKINLEIARHIVEIALYFKMVYMLKVFIIKLIIPSVTSDSCIILLVETLEHIKKIKEKKL